MLVVRTAIPAPALRPYVKCFGQHTAHIDGSLVIPLPARTEQFLMFFFRDLYLVGRQGLYVPVPRATIVGPQTRQSDLRIDGHIEAFAIHFQPTGFHCLFHLHMRELTNRTLELRSVLDASSSDLERQLAAAHGFEDRKQIAERYLLKRIPPYPAMDFVTVAARRMLLIRGTSRIDDLAADSGWTIRHLQRKFLEQVGVAPKLYARIARLKHAVETKLASAESTWTEIAHDLGYYDQMHLIHEFQELTGTSPSLFLARLTPHSGQQSTPSLHS